MGQRRQMGTMCLQAKEHRGLQQPPKLRTTENSPHTPGLQSQPPELGENKVLLGKPPSLRSFVTLKTRGPAAQWVLHGQQREHRLGVGWKRYDTASPAPRLPGQSLPLNQGPGWLVCVRRDMWEALSWTLAPARVVHRPTASRSLELTGHLGTPDANSADLEKGPETRVIPTSWRRLVVLAADQAENSHVPSREDAWVGALERGRAWLKFQQEPQSREWQLLFQTLRTLFLSVAHPSTRRWHCSLPWQQGVAVGLCSG